jgi:subtilase-type serine protease
VGALDQAGGALASYSNKAGNYADRFVVADGRGIHLVADKYEVGTSCAAPRVAGYIAIIRQKFPYLSAADAAQVILDTAVWNPAWGAKTPATQAIYGQGEASLERALAPGPFCAECHGFIPIN